MSVLHAIVLGVVQGLTEFLPVSSSGHLQIVPWLFGWDDFAGDEGLEKTFDVALHIGTLVGAVAYFWKDNRRARFRWCEDRGDPQGNTAGQDGLVAPGYDHPCRHRRRGGRGPDRAA